MLGVGSLVEHVTVRLCSHTCTASGSHVLTTRQSCDSIRYSNWTPQLRCTAFARLIHFVQHVGLPRQRLQSKYLPYSRSKTVVFHPLSLHWRIHSKSLDQIVRAWEKSELRILFSVYPSSRTRLDRLFPARTNRDLFKYCKPFFGLLNSTLLVAVKARPSRLIRRS